MDQERWIAFGPFRLEAPQGRLWRGNQVVPLRPRSLAMLRYLVAHPGRLVTKAEVRQHVWAGTHVTDSQRIKTETRRGISSPGAISQIVRSTTSSREGMAQSTP